MAVRIIINNIHQGIYFQYKLNTYQNIPTGIAK